METPLTPLEFARRSRKLYGDREGVVDGDLRLTYEQFFDRCDRWSAALQGMGVKKGDRVAYIAPNVHEQLESFYAVPQIGAVLVPINYRLTAEDFVYITSHSGAKILCVYPDYLDAIDPSVMPAVGTPEPGGLSWYQVLDLFHEICRRTTVVGMDVVELCPMPGQTRADFLAAKLVYKMIGYRFFPFATNTLVSRFN